MFATKNAVAFASANGIDLDKVRPVSKSQKHIARSDVEVYLDLQGKQPVEITPDAPAAMDLGPELAKLQAENAKLREANQHLTEAVMALEKKLDGIKADAEKLNRFSAKGSGRPKKTPTVEPNQPPPMK